ncbi:MAG: 3',5'-cyclic-nucleotide phosphodiesterase [Candidatus Rokubacteria bacterium]|nr:3',5'-cyclic-nucleotide phosphodiesterase [Candidatus Rokubacteria bacterium]
MKIRVLGAFGGEGLGQRPSAFLVNDRTLIDAGTVSGALTVPEQLEIEHALVSHTHLDHVAGLGFLTETLACCGSDRPVTVISLEPIVDAMRTSVFNNIVWPDFTQIPPEAPVVKYRTLVEDTEQRVGDLWVTPISVSHTIPTAGFIVHDGSVGFIYSGDTGPTEALWRAAKGLRGIRAVILECAFPNRLRKIADLAKHLTPDLIRREMDKLPPDVPVMIYHVKPQFYEETAAELHRIDGNRVSLLEQDKTYVLG